MLTTMPAPDPVSNEEETASKASPSESSRKKLIARFQKNFVEFQTKINSFKKSSSQSDTQLPLEQANDSSRSLIRASNKRIFNENTDSDTTQSEIVSGTSVQEDSVQLDWMTQFRGLKPLSDPHNIFKYSNLCLRLKKEDSETKILELILGGCTQFFINLRFGTPEEHKLFLSRFIQANSIATKIKGVKLITSILPQISCRTPITGKLKRGLRKIVLKTGMLVLVTADRSFASRCSKKVIYVNFYDSFEMFCPTDTIEIGDVKLEVRNSSKITLECQVVTDGQIMSEMPVNFPYICKALLTKISQEEMEDMQFCYDEKIPCVLLPTPGNEMYLKTIKKAINNFKGLRLLTCVSPEVLHNEEHALWIAQSYDGVMLMIPSCPFSENTKQFMKYVYELHKPILVQHNHSHFGEEPCQCETACNECDKSEPEYCFYYPDTICSNDIEKAETLQVLKQTGVESFTRLALRKLNDPYVDRSSTGSNSMARLIVQMSYEFKTKAILLCSTSGRMGIKISHFRPNCPAIVLTKNLGVINYLKIFSNIHIAVYRDLPESYKLSRSDQRVVRLVHGVVYGLRLGYFHNGDTVLFCYKKSPDVAYTNAVVPFRVDASTFWKMYELLNVELSCTT